MKEVATHEESWVRCGVWLLALSFSSTISLDKPCNLLAYPGLVPPIHLQGLACYALFRKSTFALTSTFLRLLPGIPFPSFASPLECFCFLWLTPTDTCELSSGEGPCHCTDGKEDAIPSSFLRQSPCLPYLRTCQ